METEAEKGADIVIIIIFYRQAFSVFECAGGR
jgi:hypothetical protein